VCELAVNREKNEVMSGLPCLAYLSSINNEAVQEAQRKRSKAAIPIHVSAKIFNFKKRTLFNELLHNSNDKSIPKTPLRAHIPAPLFKPASF
jgi:hypothetical protein